jgi:hypothetical protein
LLKEGRAKGIAGLKEVKKAAVIKSVKKAPSKIMIKPRELHVNQQCAQQEATGQIIVDK